MKMSDYQQQALNTANTTLPVRDRLAIAGLGLAGEAGEVLASMRQPTWNKSEVVMECGDLLWYCAEIASVTGFVLSDPTTPDVPDNLFLLAADISIRASEVADYIKKVVGHGHPVDTNRIQSDMAGVVHDISRLLVSVGADISEACTKNIQKLILRYPDGFSSTRSQNRVL